MRSRYKVLEPEKAHFITCTIVEWLPVFTSYKRCNILVNALAHCQKHKQMQIYGWVILDTHFHAIVHAPDLNSTLRDLKSYTAKRLLEQVTQEGQTWLLDELAFRKIASRPNEYQVWQQGGHPQAIFSDEMMLQKLDYIHNNPVERGLVAAPEHWRYSSAHEWLPGAQPVLRCDSWR
jgi:REP element-mobilizing transposase RayT